MLAFHRSLPKKVSTDVVLSAIVLLIGIVFLGTGYYHDNRLLFYIGLILALSGVLSEIFFILIARKI